MPQTRVFVHRQRLMKTGVVSIEDSPRRKRAGSLELLIKFSQKKDQFVFADPSQGNTVKEVPWKRTSEISIFWKEAW